MMRLFFKSIWNNKRRNILVFIELFMISFVLVNLTLYLDNMLAVYRIKNCYDTQNVILVDITKKNPEDLKKSPKYHFRILKRYLAQIRSLKRYPSTPMQSHIIIISARVDSLTTVSKLDG